MEDIFLVTLDDTKTNGDCEKISESSLRLSFVFNDFLFFKLIFLKFLLLRMIQFIFLLFYVIILYALLAVIPLKAHFVLEIEDVFRYTS